MNFFLASSRSIVALVSETLALCLLCVWFFLKRKFVQVLSGKILCRLARYTTTKVFVLCPVCLGARLLFTVVCAKLRKQKSLLLGITNSSSSLSLSHFGFTLCSARLVGRKHTQTHIANCLFSGGRFEDSDRQRQRDSLKQIAFLPEAGY